MIEIIVTEFNEKYSDGYITCILKEDNENNLQIAALYEGIKVYDDGRLECRYMNELEEILDKPVIIEKLLINITGWFHIHYKLIIKRKKDYTLIKIKDKYI